MELEFLYNRIVFFMVFCSLCIFLGKVCFINKFSVVGEIDVMVF